MRSTEPTEKIIRRLTWSDIGEFSCLLGSFGVHGFRRWPETADALAAELRSMRLRPERDIFLLYDGGRLSGYSLTVPEPDIARAVAGFGIAPESATHAGALLEAAIESARRRRLPVLHIASRHGRADPPHIFTGAGFKEVAANIEMTLTRSAAKSLDETPLPDGFTVRPMAQSGEVRLLTTVQNAVFTGQWGFSANTAEEVGARLRLPGSGPENVLFAESAGGEVAAYAWTSLEWDGDHTCGRVLMTGVIPDRRESGLGRAILQAAVKHLLAAGAVAVRLEVLAGNKRAAGLYRRVGFVPEGQITWYELPLQQ